MSTEVQRRDAHFPRKSDQPRVQFKFILALVVIPFILSWILGEIYIRSTVEYLTPEILENKSSAQLEFIPSLFSRLRLRKGAPKFQNSSTHWQINSLGYLGPEFTIEKKPGIKRIIIYGGSQVFDGGALRGEDWPHLVEKYLRDRNFPVEVINAGIPGAASFDSFGRFYSEGHFFQPDIAILVNAWNDLKLFSSNEMLSDQANPYVANVNPRYQYFNFVDKVLCENSQVFFQLRDRFVLWWYGIGSEGKVIAPEEREKNDIMPMPLEQYRLTYTLFAELAKAIQAVPIIIQQARLVTRNNTEEQKKKIGFHFSQLGHSGMVQGFEKADAILEEVARKTGAVFLRTEQFHGNDTLFDDHIHFLPEGSRIFAQWLAEQLVPILQSGKNLHHGADGTSSFSTLESH
ncbi:MAG: hypothetical protein HQL76_00205 [Magnetococcales bacterium]|nr:hypothetical protein [Magnetococcales bacterium]